MFELFFLPSSCPLVQIAYFLLLHPSAIRVLLSQDRRTERFSSSTGLHELEVYILRSLLCIIHMHIDGHVLYYENSQFLMQNRWDTSKSAHLHVRLSAFNESSIGPPSLISP